MQKTQEVNSGRMCYSMALRRNKEVSVKAQDGLNMAGYERVEIKNDSFSFGLVHRI